MKSFAVLLLAATVVCFKKVHSKEDLEMAVKKCRDEHKTSEDLGQIINEGAVPKSEEAKCMVACFLDSIGFMNDGKIDPVVVEKQVRDDNADLPNLDDQVSSFLKDCFEPTLELNKCEAAVFFIGCDNKKRDLTFSLLSLQLQ